MPGLRPECWSQRSPPTFGTEQLDEPHAALDQPPGDQAFTGKDLRRRKSIVQPVQPLGRRRSPLQTHELGNGRLHPEG